MPMRLVPFSTFPFAFVASMEVVATASVPLVMLPWVRQLFLHCLLFALFSSVALFLHYRCGRMALPVT